MTDGSRSTVVAVDFDWAMQIIRAARLAAYESLASVPLIGLRSPDTPLERTLLTGILSQHALRSLGRPMTTRVDGASSPAAPPQPRDGTDSVVAAVHAFIATHGLNSHLRLADVGAATGMSVWELARRFKHHTGETVLSCCHRIRVQYARRLLESTTLSVKEIAARVGYERTVSLDRHFRRHVGTTPVLYRLQSRR